MKKVLLVLLCASLSSLLTMGCEKKTGDATTTDSTSVTSKTSNSTVDANKTLSKRFYDEVINAHNVNAIDSLVAVDFVDHNPDPGQGPGLAGLKKDFAEMFTAFPDMHVAVQQMIGENDIVSTVATMTGTMKGAMMGMKPSGKAMNATLIDVIRFKDGKGAERWGLFDNMAMMTQLGFMPPHPASGTMPTPAPGGMAPAAPKAK